MNNPMKFVVFSILFIVAITSVSAYTSTVNVTSTSLGTIRSDFYGANARSLSGDVYGNTTVYATGSCTTSDTNKSYTDTRTAWNNLGFKLIRRDMSIEYASTGEGTFSNAYLIPRNQLVQWAYENGMKVSFIVSYMPSWLANTSAQCSSDTTSCPPTNYTKWTNTVILYLNNLTFNGKYNDTIQLEIWNEAYGDFMRNYSNDDPRRFPEFAKLYNETYWAIKTAYPTIKIATPALTNDAKNFTKFIFSNFTGQFDILNLHEYWANSDKFTKMPIVLNRMIANCTFYGADCSNILIGEYNLDATSFPGLVYTVNHSASISNFYTLLLNNYGKDYNIQTSFYMFDSWKANETCFTTKNYSMYDVITNATTIIYNTSRTFATNHKAGNIVYNTSSTNASLKTVISKDSSRYYLTLTNTLSSTATVTLGFDIDGKYLRDVDTNATFLIYNDEATIGDISGYGVKTYDTRSYTTGKGGGSTIYYDENGDEITRLDDPSCGTFSRLGYRLIGLCMAIIVPFGVFLFIRKKGWDNLELGDVMIIGISIIVGATFYLESASLLGNACGVVAT